VAVNCLVPPWATDAVVGDTATLDNVPEQANAGMDVSASATPTAAVVTSRNGSTRVRTDLSQLRPIWQPPPLRWALYPRLDAPL
jgi:hypothetical protein